MQYGPVPEVPSRGFCNQLIIETAFMRRVVRCR
jgi:hypothetical protein